MSICVPNQAKLHRFIVWFIVQRLTSKLRIKDFVISGSYRRGKWWCNDIDLLIKVASESEAQGVKSLMKKAGWKINPLSRRANEVIFREQFVKRVGTRYVVLDLFCCPPGSWGNALLFTTGSSKFNDKIRSKLAKMGYSWSNPRYFTHIETNSQISFIDERLALDFIGYKYVRPRLRL